MKPLTAAELQVKLRLKKSREIARTGQKTRDFLLRHIAAHGPESYIGCQRAANITYSRAREVLGLMREAGLITIMPFQHGAISITDKGREAAK